MPFEGEKIKEIPIPPEEGGEKIEEIEEKETEKPPRFEVESMPPDNQEFSKYFEDYIPPEKSLVIAKIGWEAIQRSNKEGIFFIQNKRY